jgi:predicted metal-dependent HD superfamily phosphohydrolase
MEYDDLYDVWKNTIKSMKIIPGDGYSIWSNLVKSYSKDHRVYHRLDHIEEVYSNIYTIKGSAPAWDQALAVFYHDIVYSPGAQDNELKSAQRLLADFSSYTHLRKDRLNIACALIQATRTHVPSLICEEESKELNDADLAILGSIPSRYEDYLWQVREEFKDFSNEEWIEGRSKFVESMLSKAAIFQTRVGKDLYESSARNNLSEELEKLKKGAL